MQLFKRLSRHFSEVICKDTTMLSAFAKNSYTTYLRPLNQRQLLDRGKRRPTWVVSF